MPAWLLSSVGVGTTVVRWVTYYWERETVPYSCEVGTGRLSVFSARCTGHGHYYESL